MEDPDKKAIDKLLEGLRLLTKRVPACIATASYQATVDYKKAVRKANTQLAGRVHNLKTLRDVHNKLALYFSTEERRALR